MILLADSGSTKTDWCVADGAAEICRIATHGTNPFFQSADEIAREVDGGLLPQLGNRPIEQIRFYGAGCAFPDKIAVIRDVLAARFTAADIEVGSDMLAAARALCGRNAGIACILGTGSNSCLYDGTEITANVSPLDTVIGIAASGTTPYVIGALHRAREHGILTACICSNPDSPLAAEADIPIEMIVGPELVTGSSRMKSGTGQKLICNMITTATMIKLGRVKGNRMVNMQLTNDKLVDRGTRMVADELGLGYEQAKRLLLLHGSARKAIDAYRESQS